MQVFLAQLGDRFYFLDFFLALLHFSLRVADPGVEDFARVAFVFVPGGVVSPTQLAYFVSEVLRDLRVVKFRVVV